MPKARACLSLHVVQCKLTSAHYLHRLLGSQGYAPIRILLASSILSSSYLHQLGSGTLVTGGDGVMTSQPSKTLMSWSQEGVSHVMAADSAWPFVRQPCRPEYSSCNLIIVFSFQFALMWTQTDIAAWYFHSSSWQLRKYEWARVSSALLCSCTWSIPELGQLLWGGTAIVGNSHVWLHRGARLTLNNTVAHPTFQSWSWAWQCCGQGDPRELLVQKST